MTATMTTAATCSKTELWSAAAAAHYAWSAARNAADLLGEQRPSHRRGMKAILRHHDAWKAARLAADSSRDIARAALAVAYAADRAAVFAPAVLRYGPRPCSERPAAE